MISGCFGELVFGLVETARGHTHHVHACQLGPDLREDADVCPPDHVGLKELEEGDVAVSALEFAHLLNLFEFLQNEGAIGVAFAVDECQDVMAVLPSILASEPTGRFW